MNSLPSVSLTAFVVCHWWVQVEAQDLDFDTEETKKNEPRRPKYQFERDVREIERGLYSKANVGATIYLLNHPSPFTARKQYRVGVGILYGVLYGLGSLILQTVHNGAAYDQQPGNIAQIIISSDTRGLVFGFMKYQSTTRRFGPDCV